MRQIININKGWRFSKKPQSTPTALPTDWEPVDLPHTWNGTDGQDGGNDYYRGKCAYAKALTADELGSAPVHYLQFDGVNSSVEIYWNGKQIAKHDGGYSTFRAKLPEILPENLLVVYADNSPNETVYPQMADFTFYGGIYRDVTVLGVEESHFDLDYYGAPGVQVVPTMQGTDATVAATAYVTAPAGCTVHFAITNRNGDPVAEADADAADAKTNIKLENAHLWHGTEDPYLYTLTVTLLQNGKAVDEIATRFGCRSFAIDPQKGFILNGKPYPLRGVSRHQDRPGIGNALTAKEHTEDMDLICELGANTIRLAHYQHSQIFYDLCDERGMVVWAEIPYISRHMPGGKANTISQMTELICQNSNHPSIVVWGLSNEITMNGASDPSLLENHRALNDLVHKMDPTRPTTIAVLSMCDPGEAYVQIADVLSYNHYFGWYGGKIEDNGPWLDKFHAEHPDICLGVSEYGCEGIINWHSSTPQCKDYTEEYQAVYHEYMAQAFEDRPWIWASHVWNMFDFGCAARNEGGVAGRNNKGLVTIDRKTRKDSFYLYQAYWTKDPMVHINGRRYAQRAGETTEVKVYSNQDCVTLYLNGKEVGTQQAHRVFHFTVALAEGFNTLLAVAGSAKDSITLEKVEKEPACYTLPEFNERQEGVANWFKQIGSLDLESPMKFPEGYYNIKDSMAELAKNEEAFAIVAKAVKLVTNFDLKPGQGMWSMMSGMSPEHMSGMISTDLLGDKFLPSLNAQLIKIKK